MEWVGATTLGEYVEANYANRQAMERLRVQFAALEQDLARSGLAHGDLQNGNVLVDKTQLRLVDYDGMFVSGMQFGRGMELGHKHFQHPSRRATDFGPDIDRFSFIVLDLSLWALSIRPDLFKQFSSGENILFSANDFADPDSSALFQLLMSTGDVAFQRSVADFACVCKADFKNVPRLKDFLARTSIPKPTTTSIAVAPDSASYIGALSVVDATSFEAVCKHIGDRVELVGQIVDVKVGSTKKGTPYVFINFGNWRQNSVKVTIWSEGLKALGHGNTPDPTWVGRWIVINGMIDPVYHGKNRYKTIQYVSVGPTVTDRSQIRTITKEEALWRLGRGPRLSGVIARPIVPPAPKKNDEILTQMGGGKKPSPQPWPASMSPTKAGGTSKPTPSAPSAPKPPPVQSPVKTHNEQILQNMGTVPSSSSTSDKGAKGTPQSTGCAIWAAMMLGGLFSTVAYLLIIR